MLVGIIIMQLKLFLAPLLAETIKRISLKKAYHFLNPKKN